MSLLFTKRLVSTRRRRRRRRRRRSCAFGSFLRDSLGDFGAQGGGEAQSDRGGAGTAGRGARWRSLLTVRSTGVLNTRRPPGRSALHVELSTYELQYDSQRRWQSH